MNRELFDAVVVHKLARKYRETRDEDIAAAFASQGLSPQERMTRRFEMLCAGEKPHFLPGQKICLLRTAGSLPPVFTDDEWTDIRSVHYIHELGFRSNLCPDYAKVLSLGLLGIRAGAGEYAARAIDALLALVGRWRLAAEEEGLTGIADTLSRVPAYGARTYREALQSVRAVNYALWLEGSYHNTLGRFDRYMLPYFEADTAAGALSEDEALDLTEDFFLSLNIDSDLYPGVQQGDNGQSLMLGGSPRCGGFNRLSELCLQAAGELKLIDPKINVRVGRGTPEDVFTLCSTLTKAGLGFPQYSNDDVVIPGLVCLGYRPDDAEQYTVAACWEFIIPGLGGDTANIAALSFPKIIDTCLHRDLCGCHSYEDFLAAADGEISRRCREINDSVRDLWFVPSPLLEALMDWPGGVPVYRNTGMHGVGLSTAADSLAAVKHWVFDEGSLDGQRLIAAIDSDFAGEPELLHRLRYETDKLGRDEKNDAQGALVFLLDAFSRALKGLKNCDGGVWRPGTGSAMYYLWSAREIGASPDGRRKGEPFAANYSVSLFARPDGPFSVIRSMTAPDLTRVINGGPLTLEFHSSVFDGADSTVQVGRFVKKFIELGGHQLQLNAVNADTIRDAQAHPEKYPLLIVRVWGWSAYFVELDRAYQDHVIARQEYGL